MGQKEYNYTYENGQTVARYLYDALGVCTVVSDTSGCGIANINPYRYRGYYYDKETELYYLQSRYYDPKTGRFINGDAPVLMGTSETKIGHDLFTYCENEPIMNSDFLGYVSVSALKKESWIARAVLKYIPSISYNKKTKTIFKTPKWLGIYLEAYVGVSTQTNPSGIIGFGFSNDSFDVGIYAGSGRTSIALVVGVSWTETYIQASFMFSSKKGHVYFSINFKLAIKHWFAIAVAAICYIVPALAPVVGYVIRILSATTRVAKPILCAMLPILLKV